MSFLRQGIEIPFTNGSYQSRSKPFSSQRCINYRPNIAPAPALSPEGLYQTEGIAEVLSSLLDAPCRGSHTMNSKPYFVIGASLYRIDRVVNPDLSEVFSAVLLGSIAGSGEVLMDSGWSGTGYELAIVSPGIEAYAYREASGLLTTLTGTANFLSPVEDVVNINGFFVFVQTGTNTIFHSNLNEISTYNALDFELVTRTSRLVGLIKYRGQIYAMGDKETLPYTFIGGANFVFQYQPNSTIPSGLNNVTAKTSVRQSFCYLGGGENESPAVWLSSGGYPQKISTEAIDYRIRGNSLLSSSSIYGFSIDGGEYIALRVADDCFVYDLNTGRWHERRSTNGDDDIAWRANHITLAYGRLMVGDSIDGRIGTLDSVNTEYGVEVNRQFTLQPFDNKGRALMVSDILLAMDTGFGGEMSMDYSDDGGNKWSNGLIASAGATGEYGKHVAWNRLGSTSFARTFRFGTSSATPCNVSKVLAIA